METKKSDSDNNNNSDKKLCIITQKWVTYRDTAYLKIVRTFHPTISAQKNDNNGQH